ncbi:uncharacterized protein KGF55_002148 [Candida pseudojiufengensis]|uniref:uncharacterized protein n=1 Tax=Candida pseudojiufengensis TaxID=497109 RepID=UPI002224C6C2|nr:uncharacterized protein KGF55_002148 [Candida pseudojiufengensis]KAI5964206.1 hypothetical protein KGF55_002148 [Candida pseudojiufengensis]
MNFNDPSQYIKHNQAFFRKFKPIVYRDKPIIGHTTTSTEIITISINPCGSRVVYSRTDKTIRIYKSYTDGLYDPITIEDAHLKSVESISWNPKTEFDFATVGNDENIKIWRSLNGSLVNIIKTELKNLRIVRYSIDGEILIAIDKSSTILIYSVLNNYKLIQKFIINEYIYDLQWFNYEHSYFILALHDGSSPIYEINNDGEFDPKKDNNELYKIKTIIKGHRSSTNTIAVSPKGSYFVIGGSDGIISIWNTINLLNKNVITDIDQSISNISCSRDGTYFSASFEKNSNSIIYDNDLCIKMFEIPNSESGKFTFNCVYWFPSKTEFVYSSDFGTTLTLMHKPEETRTGIRPLNRR